MKVEIAGSWRGSDGATFEAYRILGGCAVMGFLAASEGSEFLFLTYTGEANGWETDVLDSDRSTPLQRYRETASWNELRNEDGDCPSRWRNARAGLLPDSNRQTIRPDLCRPHVCSEVSSPGIGECRSHGGYD